jgi:tight adherence protein B
MTAVLVSLVVSAVGLAALRVRGSIVPIRIAGGLTRTPTHRWLLGLRRPRRLHPSDDDIAEWCEQVARGVRAGSSLAHAIEQTGITAPAGASAFQPVVHALSRGRGLADALGVIDGAADPASAIGLVVPVLTACAELGGPAAMPLERVAATLHARSAERAERRTNSAQARLSARVLTTVPLGVLALLALAEPAVRSSLTSTVGVVCIVVGGSFNLAGWYWMRRLIGRAG